MKANTLSLTRTALFTALVFLATFIPHIPIPLGYAHLGDAVIFLLAFLFDRKEAMLAACLGSMLSDLLSGFPLWAVPTLIIKAGMVWIIWRLVPDGQVVSKARQVVVMLCSSLWMAVAYTLFGAVLAASLVAGLGSFPGLAMEGIVNTIVAVLLLPALAHAVHSFH